KDVVESDPDVPYAVNDVLTQRLPGVGRLQGQLLFGRIGAEHQGLRGYAAGRDPLHQAAVRRVHIEQQRVAGLEVSQQAVAARGERKNRVGAVAVLVQRQRAGRFDGAALFTRRKLQVAGCIAGDVV